MRTIKNEKIKCDLCGKSISLNRKQRLAVFFYKTQDKPKRHSDCHMKSIQLKLNLDENN